MLELEAAHDLTMPCISWWLRLRNTIGIADDTELLSTINAAGTGTLTRADRIDEPAVQLLFPLTQNTGAAADYYVPFTNWEMDTLLAIGLDWKTTPGLTPEMKNWVKTRPLAWRDALLLIAEKSQIDSQHETPSKKPKI